MSDAINLIRRSYPDEPEYGTAVSRAILIRVAAGELPPTMRIHRPGREVAFGRRDIVAPGYERAAAAAIAKGFAAVERLAGGRAAVFHEGTIALTRAYPDPQPPKRTYARFAEMAGLVRDALARIGIVDPRIGEVPGEYCPGAYSVNAGGRRKLAGVGQRMIKGGAHVGAVVVASGADEIRGVLKPVYEALELDWLPETPGSAADELGREVGPEELIEALVAGLAAAHEIEEADVDPETIAVAERLLRERA
ncbi:MAG: lipoate--protein ligase family protein [Actinomycetota bacterium]|nr:lipoate--protein ligase family protein [Actinomycetota bacterium]